jgi:hypothetical protein
MLSPEAKYSPVVSVTTTVDVPTRTTTAFGPLLLTLMQAGEPGIATRDEALPVMSSTYPVGVKNTTAIDLLLKYHDEPPTKRALGDCQHP